VLVVDDQAIFRRALRELIDATPGFELVGEAASGPDGAQLAEELQPDVVMLEVRMSGMDGLEVSRRLTAASPRSLLVLMSVESISDLPSAVRSATHLRKQDLSPRALREVWDTHRPPGR
jgi:DNA-binding NarL/FixJ family response regulator